MFLYLRIFLLIMAMSKRVSLTEKKITDWNLNYSLRKIKLLDSSKERNQNCQQGNITPEKQQPWRSSKTRFLSARSTNLLRETYWEKGRENFMRLTKYCVHGSKSVAPQTFIRTDQCYKNKPWKSKSVWTQKNFKTLLPLTDG